MAKKEYKNFVQRLKTACDECEPCPPHGAGRQTWIAGKLNVSQQSAAKWLNAEALPRPNKMTALAQLLGVDEAWLALGLDSGFTRTERKQLSAAAEGAEYYMFGLLTMAGHSCAFPTSLTEEAGISLYAIRGGVQVAVGVSLGREESAGVFVVRVEKGYERRVNLAVIPAEDAPSQYYVVRLGTDAIAVHGKRARGALELTLHENEDDYSTGRHHWPIVEDLSTLS